MTTPHKHAEVIKAWADGKTIEYFNLAHINPQWTIIKNPVWDTNIQYRVKPEPRPTIKLYQWYVCLPNSKTPFSTQSYFQTPTSVITTYGVNATVRKLESSELEVYADTLEPVEKQNV